MNINTQLFITFTKIGGFTIGGGMAMVPLMEAEIVDKQKWLTKEEFLDIMAVSQATPGIFAIDMASHIGYKVSGLKGAILSALGNILPSLVIILAIAFCFSRFKDNVYVEAVFKGIRPAVVALITLPVFSMAKSARLTRHNLWIPILSTVLIWLLGVSPVYIIAAAGIGGYMYGRHLKRREIAAQREALRRQQQQQQQQQHEPGA
jgi:chromate transporter